MKRKKLKRRMRAIGEELRLLAREAGYMQLSAFVIVGDESDEDDSDDYVNVSATNNATGDAMQLRWFVGRYGRVVEL